METTITKVRLDKYLWSIRVFKTRSQATDAIDRGRVKLKGENVKGIYWTRPDSSGKEEIRAKKINEAAYSLNCSSDRYL